MEHMVDIQFFQLPSQGNVYGISRLSMVHGFDKLLVASLKREVFCFEYGETNNSVIIPITKEILFTYIPTGAEIISLDAFNKSNISNDIVIGITIIKADHSKETYLNIYSGEDSSDFNVDNIAQNCLMIELDFIPYQLTHTLLSICHHEEIKTENVWLLSGSDNKIHMYQEYKPNHGYKEVDIKDHFPELLNPPSIVIWLDIVHLDNMSKRLSAYGCECGYVKLSCVETKTGNILNKWDIRTDNMVSSVKIFAKNENLSNPIKTETSDDNKSDVNYNLLVVNTSQCSVVFNNVLNEGLSNKCILESSDQFNVSSCSCVADIDLDGENEILLGTYGQEILVYKNNFENEWNLIHQRSFSNPIHSIKYFDLSGDGVKELLILTLRGVHVLQYDPEYIKQLLLERYKRLFKPSSNLEDVNILTKKHD